MEQDFFQSTASYRVQKTLKAPLSFKGVGLHSGTLTKIRLNPAPANHGITLQRTDLKSRPHILAHFDSVISTELATSLGHMGDRENRISTVEHLLSAVYAFGLTNLHIEVLGPEVPILDGSALPFVEGILDTGIAWQPFSQPTLKILKPVKVYQNNTVCELLPRDRLRLTTTVDFSHPSIGAQTFAVELTPKAFTEDVSRARTFGFMTDLEKLKAAKLAQGATLENVLAFTHDGVLNPEGQRYTDEVVRHKLLDAIGDLALCGSWIQGEMVSFRGGHSIHLTLLKSLKDFPSHWVVLPAEPLPLGSVVDWDGRAKSLLSHQVYSH